MANGKISVDVFWKLTNSFTYILPYTNYFKKNIKNIPKRICDTDEEYDLMIGEISKISSSKRLINQYL